MKRQIISIKNNCSKSNAEDIQRNCESLPKAQQLAVQACFELSKLKDARGMRYTNQWIYECILLRIKSKKTYDHLRNHKILALPTTKTLSRYIQSIKGTYGFQNSTFEILKQKTQFMDESDCRGMIIKIRL